jgi:hypothetical protein
MFFQITTITIVFLFCLICTIFKIFQKSFIFWFNISEDIYTNEHSEEACNNFQKYVENLLENICKHRRLPQNHVSLKCLLLYHQQQQLIS